MGHDPNLVVPENKTSLDKLGHVQASRDQFYSNNIKKVHKIIIPEIKDKSGLIRTSLDKFRPIWTSLEQFG